MLHADERAKVAGQHYRRGLVAVYVANVVSRWWGLLIALVLLVAASGAAWWATLGYAALAGAVAYAWGRWDRPAVFRPYEEVTPGRGLAGRWPELAADAGLGSRLAAADALAQGAVPHLHWFGVLFRVATVAEARTFLAAVRDADLGDRTPRYPWSPELVELRENAHEARLTVRPLPGQDVAVMSRRGPALALAAEVREVRFRRAEDPALVEVLLRWGDPLAGTVPVAAPTPHRAGAEPVRRPPSVVVGVREDGSPWDLNLREMTLVGGVPGSGKSVLLNKALVEAGRYAFVQLVLIDLKGGLEFAPHEPRAAVVAGTHEEALEALTDVLAIMDDRMVRMRTAGVRYFGDIEDGFTPDDPFIVVVVDEAAELFAATADRTLGRDIEAAMSRLVRLSRAMGIVVTVATQKPTADAVPSQVRDALQNRVCLRVATVEAARAVLGDPLPEMTEAATSITHEQKGYAVLRSPDGSWEMARSGFLPDADVERAVAALAHLRRPLAIPALVED